MKPLVQQIRQGLRALTVLVVLLLASITTGNAWAHKGSDAYLQVNDRSGVSGVPSVPVAVNFQFSVAIKDLELALPVDVNGDGKVTWGEIKAATPAISDLLSKEIGIADANPMIWMFDGLESRGDGSYVRFRASSQIATTSVGAPLALRYSLFKAQDASHRLLVAGKLDGKDLLLTVSPTQGEATVLRAGSGTVSTMPASLSPGADTTAEPNSAWRSLTQYFLLGVHHLLEGYDHLAFLLALVLPLHLLLWPRKAGVTALSAQPLSQSHEWGRLLRTITAFTLGHSITLILATLGYTSASPVWVEPAIAMSIGVSALLNIYPQRWLRTELLAGAFGLVHGYGFAGLLLEAAAPSGLLGWALGGFNLGVEAGQLIAVTGWVIVSQPLVGKPFYDRWVLHFGSWLLVMLSVFWFLERVL